MEESESLIKTITLYNTSTDESLCQNQMVLNNNDRMTNLNVSQYIDLSFKKLDTNYEDLEITSGTKTHCTNESSKIFRLLIKISSFTEKN